MTGHDGVAESFPPTGCSLASELKTIPLGASLWIRANGANALALWYGAPTESEALSLSEGREGLRTFSEIGAANRRSGSSSGLLRPDA